MSAPFDLPPPARHDASGGDHAPASPVRLPSGRLLDPHRSRWQGPLDAEELDYCRAHSIALAYDCAQIGWVPAACTDDAPIAVDNSRPVDLTQFVSPEQDARRLLAMQTARTAAEELAPRIAAFHARHGVKAANQCHLALHAARARAAAGPPDGGLAAAAPDGGLAAAAPDEFSFRAWTAADAPRYRAMLDNPRLWEYLPESYPQPLTDATALALIELGRVDARQQAVAVVRDGEPVGQCLLRFHEPFAGQRAAEVAYWLAEEHWGKGWMSRILPAFVAHCFAQHDVEVIEAWIHADHAASARVAVRSGFQRDTFAFEAELAAVLGKPRAQRYVVYRGGRARAAADRRQATADRRN